MKPRTALSGLLVGGLVVALSFGGAVWPDSVLPPPPGPVADVAPSPVTTPAGETVTVTAVTDGDTFKSGPEKYRVLVLDSCEMSTPGGKDARADALELLDGQTVTVTSEPGVDRDRYDRRLVYVQLEDGRDFAETMLGREHSGVYAKKSDASPARTAAGRAADTDGRDCGATPAASSTKTTTKEKESTSPAAEPDRETNRRDYTGDPRSNAEINTEAEGGTVTYRSSGEAQYDWGCQQGYITEGC